MISAPGLLVRQPSDVPHIRMSLTKHFTLLSFPSFILHLSVWHLLSSCLFCMLKLQRFFCLEAGSELHCLASSPSAGWVHVRILFTHTDEFSDTHSASLFGHLENATNSECNKYLTSNVLNMECFLVYMSTDKKDITFILLYITLYNICVLKSERKQQLPQKVTLQQKENHPQSLSERWLCHLQKTLWWVLKASAQPFYTHTSVLPSAWLHLLSGCFYLLNFYSTC